MLIDFLLAGAVMAGFCLAGDRASFSWRRGKRFETAMFTVVIVLAWPPLLALFAVDKAKEWRAR